MPPERRVWLPRGSIYIMTGRSRTDWKHAIYRTGAAGLVGSGTAAPPPWNPLGWRRSWTFRATKVFQLATLRRELRSAPLSTRASLVARIAAQMESYPPKKDGFTATCNASDLEALEAAAARMLRFIDMSAAAQGSRVPPADVRVPLDNFAPQMWALYDGSGGSATSISEHSSATTKVASVPGSIDTGAAATADSRGRLSALPGPKGFAFSGFGGSAREVVTLVGGSSGDAPGCMSSIGLGTFPQGYGLGFENARDGGEARGSGGGRRGDRGACHVATPGASTLSSWLASGRSRSSVAAPIKASGAPTVMASFAVSGGASAAAATGVPSEVVVIDDSDDCEEDSASNSATDVRGHVRASGEPHALKAPRLSSPSPTVGQKRGRGDSSS